MAPASSFQPINGRATQGPSVAVRIARPQPAVNDLVVKPKPGALLILPLAIVALAIGRGLAQAVPSMLF